MKGGEGAENEMVAKRVKTITLDEEQGKRGTHTTSAASIARYRADNRKFVISKKCIWGNLP